MLRISTKLLDLGGQQSVHKLPLGIEEDLPCLLTLSAPQDVIHIIETRSRLKVNGSVKKFNLLAKISTQNFSL